MSKSDITYLRSQQGSLGDVSSNPQSNSPQLQSLGDSAYGSDLVKKDDNTGECNSFHSTHHVLKQVMEIQNLLNHQGI
jgi:hypothetical protein